MRIRVTFSKTGPLRYTGNLDLHTIWERAARRADLPLAYSHGFHPQPKIQIAAPLPLGCSSRCEVVDLRLNDAADLQGLAARLESVLPEGIRVQRVESVSPDEPALQSRLEAAEYEAILIDAYPVEEIKQRIGVLMQGTAARRERRGKSYDLRPLIEQLWLDCDNLDGSTRIRMQLSAREGATGRPDEVLDALGLPIEAVRVERTRLIFQA